MAKRSLRAPKGFGFAQPLSKPGPKPGLFHLSAHHYTTLCGRPIAQRWAFNESSAPKDEVCQRCLARLARLNERERQINRLLRRAR